MMNTITLRAAGLGILCLMAGCTSTPLRYYTLQPPPASPLVVAPPAYQFQLLPVTVPAAVDREERVVRQDLSSLAVLEGERWAAPLGEEVRAMLAADVARRLGTPNLDALPRGAGQPLVRARLVLQRFDVWPGGQAAIEAGWTLSRADASEQAKQQCTAEFSRAAPLDGEGQVAALQTLLAQLSARLAASVQAYAAGQAGCG
ncbi:PqiC family protein [Chitinimonas sp.]|uniref:PqiC family protein n=1 Tax=Chitinimonas sp. TaxID=1934313 RepID=UPI002F942334